MISTIPDDVVAFCRECQPEDPAAFFSRCERLRQLLEEANRQTNLTSITDADEFWRKHVADSLSIGKFFGPALHQPTTLADIGCGAGFPALILGTAYPQLKITAIDSIGKKTAFVAAAAAALELSNLTVVTARSKELGCKAEWQGRFMLLTARAVADARKLFRENRQLLHPDGQFIFYKTPLQAAGEIGDVSKDSLRFHWCWQTTPVFELPGSSGSRQFLFSEKMA